MPPNPYTISKLAEDAGVSVHMVRDYERRGLLSACDCMSGGYRIYNKDTLSRLKFIRLGMAVGVSLTDIGNLLQSFDQNNSNDTQQAAKQLDQQLTQQMMLNRQFSHMLNHLISAKTVTDGQASATSPL